MWTYILKRLLIIIPTLFGVTVVSFCVMQLAPGDPLLKELGSGGAQGRGETRETYLIRRKEMKLGKPLILNFNYFKSHDDLLRCASYYYGRDVKQMAADLAKLAEGSADDDARARLTFLESLEIHDFRQRLSGELLDPQQRELERQTLLENLAKAIHTAIRVRCETLEDHGIPPAITILKSDADRRMKIGAIKCLLRTTLQRPEVRQEVPLAHRVKVWRQWWLGTDERPGAKKKFDEEEQQLEPDEREEARRKVRRGIESLAADPKYKETLAGQIYDKYFPQDVPYFMEVLLDESAGDRHREIALVALAPLADQEQPPRIDYPEPDVEYDADELRVEQIAQHWVADFYELQRDKFDPPLSTRLRAILFDTQYANMAWRLITFDFGQSMQKEIISEVIWEKFCVSAPIMLMSEVVIFLAAVPLGILCAVNRGNWIDRLISLKLYFLYSIPGFVAAMLFLLFLCYGDPFLDWFPMKGLHADDAATYNWFWYSLDYVWHCFLPVVCLSLFSLAAVAMYARTSMLDVLNQDYIRTARAKGLSRSKVVLKHALRNSLIPVITLFANFLPAMLGGSVLVEVLFDIPGLGRLGFDSIQSLDFQVLMALLYINAIIVLLSILLTDLLYLAVDPRISFEAQGKST